MNIKEFTKEVTNKISEKISDVKAEATTVTKNNNVEYEGIAFRKEGEKTQISPVIYTNYYYDNNCTVDETAEKILEVYNRSIKTQNFEIDKDKMFTKDFIKDNVFVRLVNYEKNKEALKKLPYMLYGDIAVVLRVSVSNKEENGFASFALDNIALEHIGVTKEEIFDIAVKNYKKNFPLTITTLYDIVADRIDPNIDKDMFEHGLKMYVLTSKDSFLGSYYMLDRDALMQVAEKLNSDKIIILPSSIHEIIALSYEDGKDDELNKLVTEVNNTEVEAEEVLSYSVYTFDSTTGKLSFINGDEITTLI